MDGSSGALSLDFSLHVAAAVLQVLGMRQAMRFFSSVFLLFVSRLFVSRLFLLPLSSISFCPCTCITTLPVTVAAFAMLSSHRSYCNCSRRRRWRVVVHL